MYLLQHLLFPGRTILCHFLTFQGEQSALCLRCGQCPAMCTLPSAPFPLQDRGLYRGKADNKMSLPLCSRSKDVIEPMLKPQWWVNCAGMAAKAADAARSGDLEIIPAEFEAVWYRCVCDKLLCVWCCRLGALSCYHRAFTGSHFPGITMS